VSPLLWPGTQKLSRNISADRVFLGGKAAATRNETNRASFSYFKLPLSRIPYTGDYCIAKFLPTQQNTETKPKTCPYVGWNSPVNYGIFLVFLFLKSEK
jgi:hypothetical protein